MYKSLIATLVLMSQLTHAYQDNSTITVEEVTFCNRNGSNKVFLH